MEPIPMPYVYLITAVESLIQAHKTLDSALDEFQQGHPEVTKAAQGLADAVRAIRTEYDAMKAKQEA